MADDAALAADNLAADAAAVVDAVVDDVEAAAESIQTDAADAADAVADAAADATAAVTEALDAASADVQDAMEILADDARAVVASTESAAADAAAAARAAVDGAAAAAADVAADARAALTAPPSTPPFQELPLVRAPVDPPAGADTAHSLRYLKTRLLAAVAGLDRGAAASPAAADEVEATAAALIAIGGPVDLTWAPAEGADANAPSPVDALAGTWRLLYSSTFRRSSGRGRVGPLALGQIYQVISPHGSRLDNVVELIGPAPPPLPFPALPGSSAATPPSTAPVTLTATLRHTLEVGGGGAGVTITFDGTDVRADGGLAGLLGSLPSLTLPSLPSFMRPPTAQRTSGFDVLYLDGDVRVTRGERGELRVFGKVAA